MNTDLNYIGQQAKVAARHLTRLSRAEKDAALLAIADALAAHQDEILAANAEDVAAARTVGTSPALIDRMLLTRRDWR